MDECHKKGGWAGDSLLVSSAKLDGAEGRVMEAAMTNRKDLYPISGPEVCVVWETRQPGLGQGCPKSHALKIQMKLVNKAKAKKKSPVTEGSHLGYIQHAKDRHSKEKGITDP